MTRSRGPLARLLHGIARAIDGARRVVFNLLFLLLVAVILAALLGDRTPVVPEGGALVIAPEGVLVDQRSYVDPLASLASGDALAHETLVSDLVLAIDAAAQDERIRLIVLQLDAMEQAGLSKLQELAQALARFRQQGKLVVAMGDSFSQEQYWLAAQADQVFLNPMGAVLLEGYGVFNHYFREALDRLAVTFHVFRVGSYKAAVEPVLRSDMSAEARENNARWVGALWEQYKAGVAARRGFDPEHLQAYIAGFDQVLTEHAGDGAQAALSWRLVDDLKSRGEMEAWLVEQVGADAEGQFRGIDVADYLVVSRQRLAELGLPKIGVVVASGMILDGEQRPGLVGGDTLAALIRQARFDDEIKAVVLRIDSEGGSAFASEIIRQELLALKAAGKPLVVSMGSVAASGGYWIAADADRIFATPATITGSIGIFGLLPTINQSLNRLGIYSDGVGTTPLAGALRVDRPLPPQAARALQSSIEHGYRQFLAVVAGGRQLPVAAVAQVAEGRIWAGSEAVGNALVDELGTLSDAIAHAGRSAGLDHYLPAFIEPPLSPQDLLWQQLTGSVELWLRARLETAAPAVSLFASALGGAGGPLALPLWRWNDPHANYLLCTACGRL